MIALVSEILILLAIAAILGGLVGWGWHAAIAGTWLDRATADMAARLEELEEERDELAARVADREATLEALRRQWETESIRLAGLEGELADLRDQTVGGGGTAGEARVLREHLRRAEQRIAMLERKLAEAGRPVRSSAPFRRPLGLRDAPEGAPDDLSAIKGVGPKLQKVLNELGIWHYRQLAALDEGEIRWLSAEIGAFPDRIERERWIEQARELMQKDEVSRT